MINSTHREREIERGKGEREKNCSTQIVCSMDSTKQWQQRNMKSSLMSIIYLKLMITNWMVSHNILNGFLFLNQFKYFEIICHRKFSLDLKTIFNMNGIYHLNPFLPHFLSFLKRYVDKERETSWICHWRNTNKMQQQFEYLYAYE